MTLATRNLIALAQAYQASTAPGAFFPATAYWHHTDGTIGAIDVVGNGNGAAKMFAMQRQAQDETTQPRALFPAGQCVATRGALQALADTFGVAVNVKPGQLNPLLSAKLFAMLQRHTSGDWGQVDPEDAQTNADAVRYGNRVLSSYDDWAGFKKAPRLWIITEADRSATTILTPDEY